MLNSEFHERARAFLVNLLRQRDYLTVTHKGKKPLADIAYAASFIRLHLEANGYRDNRQMARFWESHQDKIRTLLPGLGSPTYIPMLTRFNNLLWEAGLYHPSLLEDQLRFTYSNS